MSTSKREIGVQNLYIVFLAGESEKSQKVLDKRCEVIILFSVKVELYAQPAPSL